MSSGPRQRLGRKHPNQETSKEGIGPGLRGQPAHEAPEIFHTPGPLETSKVRGKLWRVRGFDLILRSPRDLALLQGT